jgi:hypothetical protein
MKGRDSNEPVGYVQRLRADAVVKEAHVVVGQGAVP